MTDTIIDSGNVMEAEGIDDADADFADLTATEEADPDTMDFHVQMRGYTMRDFEVMVVHAAATQLVGNRDYRREIEAKAAEIASEKVNDRLNEALKDVMGMTVAKRGQEAVTLGQMIGMEAKDYLTEKVDQSGKPYDGWGGSASPRVQHLAGKFIRETFSKEIETAFKALRDELKSAVEMKMTAVIEDERKKLSSALGYELTKRR